MLRGLRFGVVWQGLGLGLLRVQGLGSLGCRVLGSGSLGGRVVGSSGFRAWGTSGLSLLWGVVFGASRLANKCAEGHQAFRTQYRHSRLKLGSSQYRAGILGKNLF